MQAPLVVDPPRDDVDLIVILTITRSHSIVITGD